MTTLVVPAAGEGSRLGGAAPKALIELDGRPLIEWVVSAASGLVDHVVAVIRPAGLAYDVRPISARLKQYEDAGVALAHAGRYHGTFNFLGRMQHSPERRTRDDLLAWFAQHPDGRAIVYFNRKRPMGDMTPEYSQYYQGDIIAIVSREQWAQWWAAHTGKEAREADAADQ